jgi:hypothetical protein
VACELAACTIACAAGDDDGTSHIGGRSGGTGGDTVDGGMTGGSGGGGGSTSTGGNGGFGAIPGSGGGGGAGGFDSDSGCTGISETAANKKQPSDIVLAIDQSGSMDEETAWVRQQLNGFSQQIIASGIDVHVVLIAGITGENPLCIDPPLGSGGCPQQDDNPPQYRHVDQHVDSHDAFEQIVNTYDLYKDVLRPEASKHVLVITDDTPGTMTAAAFDAALKAKDPMWQNFFFHAIVPSKDSPSSFQCLLSPEPCCGVAAGSGTAYVGLVQQTSGIYGDLCLQNFQPVWNQLSTAVVSSSTLACEWDIPAPPSGQTLDANKVNVVYTGGGQEKTLGNIAGSAECSQYKDAWYYDDNTTPTKIFVCPEVCQEIQGAQAQKVDIIFGCATEPPVPK